MFAINEILDIAVRLEKNSEAVYRRAAAEVSIPEIEAALAWIADEEALHAEWFEGLKEDDNVQAVKLSPEDFDGNFLNSIIGGQSFSLEDVDFLDIEKVSELLDVFIESEKDGILFYEMLKPFILEEKTRNLLDSIITEEQRHIKTFREVLTTPSIL